MNDNLYLVNLISDCSPGKLPEAKALEDQWRQDLPNREEQIGKVQDLNWDAFWFFLVKPHIQQMATKCLADVVNLMVPELSDAMYTTQLHSRLSHPPEVEQMLSICQLQV